VYHERDQATGLPGHDGPWRRGLGRSIRTAWPARGFGFPTPVCSTPGGPFAFIDKTRTVGLPTRQVSEFYDMAKGEEGSPRKGRVPFVAQWSKRIPSGDNGPITPRRSVTAVLLAFPGDAGGGRSEPHFIRECILTSAAGKKKPPKSLAEHRPMGI